MCIFVCVFVLLCLNGSLLDSPSICVDVCVGVFLFVFLCCRMCVSVFMFVRLCGCPCLIKFVFLVVSCCACSLTSMCFCVFLPVCV